MPRYTQLGPRDDPCLEEGDEAFLGFRSRVQPAALPSGVARYIENGRCDRGTFRPRKGTKAVSTDLELVNPPVVLDFELPTEISVTSITCVGTTATVTTATNHGFTTGDTVGVEGATGANGLLYNGDFEITVTGATTFTYTMGGTPSGSAAGTLVCAKGLRIFDSYSDLVRCACTYARLNNVEGVVMAITDKAYVYRAGESIAEIDYPAGEEVSSTDDCDLVQFLDKVYLFRGYQTAEAITLSSLTRSSSTATATKIAHGLAAGTWVDVQGATEVEYNGIFQIATVPTADTFTYTVTGTPASPATGTITARPCKPVLQWDCDVANDFTVVPTGYHPTGGGVLRMPAAPWGIEFNRRVIVPFSRTEHGLSDFGDAATFDRWAQLRILPGGVDWLIGVFPFQLQRYFVLYRKSVHQVELDNTDPDPVAIREVTRAFGCVARKSVAASGDLILWLSDLGVTGLQVTGELNAIPLNLPLSDRIQDQIEEINWAAAHKAVGVCWNNRYYLAVPTGTSELNNTVLVFNFLNRSSDAPLGEWESVDTFPGDFDIQAFHFLDYEGRKRLHVSTSFGFLYVIEELEADDWGNNSGTVGTYPIVGKLYLRDFQLGTRERKLFVRMRLTSNLTQNDAFSVDFVSRNPDRRTRVHTYTAATTTDANASKRIPRIRGAAGTLEIETSAGRPEIRSVALEATITDRADNVRI